MSFGGGVLKSTDQGCSWYSIHTTEGIMYYDMAVSTVNSKKLWLAGANDSSVVLFFSYDQGENWVKTNNTLTISMNEVLVVEDLQFVLVGSWNDGCYLMRNDYTWSKMTAIDFDAITDLWIDHNNVLHVFNWGNGIYKMDLKEL